MQNLFFYLIIGVFIIYLITYKQTKIIEGNRGIGGSFGSGGGYGGFGSGGGYGGFGSGGMNGGFGMNGGGMNGDDSNYGFEIIYPYPYAYV